jgi:N-acetyl-beta-hexosaminidase
VSQYNGEIDLNNKVGDIIFTRNRIRFVGELEELEDGIKILSNEVGYELSEDGIVIDVQKVDNSIEILYQDGRGLIKYSKKVHFYRALGLFLQELNNQDSFCILEEPQFTMNCPMFDCSRNAVLKVESIKRILRKMALMGLDALMLYTEDTYEIKGQPYFGYMRGRYTYDEMKACDDYAYTFGIDMIPCIQTLGHMERFLRWDAAAYLKDTERELLVESDETYAFLEEAIKAATAPFRSKRIHIGMDEAHGLGLGKYMDENGYKNRFDLMTEHLKRVMQITNKYGLRPMMWSDMYFRLGSKSGDYYDVNSNIPKSIIPNIPLDIQMVYWDYYHNDEEFYRTFIKKHKDLGSTPVFAGGIWVWVGMGTNYARTFSDMGPALDACKKEGVKEVIATIWNDDGGENNYFSTLMGLQFFAEHGYSKTLDMDKFKDRVKFCTGLDYEAFRALNFLDETPGTLQNNSDASNPSKFLLWQEILMGLFDKHIEGHDISGHYNNLEEIIKNYRDERNELDFIFEVPQKLCAVLKIKSDIGIKIKNLYDNGDKSGLSQVAEVDLRELYEKVNEMRITHRDQWFDIYKPSGWEIIDIRYGGLLARIDSAVKRLTDYVVGDVQRIEEIEFDRLYFDGPIRPENTGLGLFHIYQKIASVNGF